MTQETKGKRIGWLDEQSHPLIEHHARQLDSFLQAMADGEIDPHELRAQEARLVALMKEIEPRLDDAVHEQVTRLLCELVAYDQMQMVHTMQEARTKSVFRG